MLTRDIITIRGHGRRFEIEDPDGLIGASLRKGSPYEARVLEHIWRLVRSGEIPVGSTAVDAGAHVGNHSLWLACICGLVVHAFEPIYYGTLERNLRRNAERSVGMTVYRYALGARLDTAEAIGAGELRVGEGQVPIRPLDELELTDVSLMKIDVEGMEPDVIAGAADTIRRYRPRIFAEARDDHAADLLAAALDPFGYEHVKTYGSTPLLEWVVP